MKGLNRETFRRLNPFSPCRRCGAQGIYPAATFRAIIERESHRSDRNTHEFSIAVFPVPEKTGSCEIRANLVATLDERVRCTDEVGWLGTRAIGVLLPETHGRGAWMLADKVLTEMAERGLPLMCQVFVYPSHGNLDNDAPGSQLWFEGLCAPPTACRLPGDEDAEERFRQFDLIPPPADLREPVSDSSPDEESMEEFLEQPSPVWKRSLDVAGTLLGLLFLSPVMLVIAILIKVQSPGSVFFLQDRVGYRGRIFKCWKFRTMHQDADDSLHREHVTRLVESGEPLSKLDEQRDPRLIPIGRFLRSTGLDELPQLFNVLRGEMSLIGPRPCIPYEYTQFERWHRRRTESMPGITGLWQVSGKNRTTFTEMMRLDIAYGREKSLRQDANILMRTVPAVIEQVREEDEDKEKVSKEPFATVSEDSQSRNDSPTQTAGDQPLSPRAMPVHQ